MERKDGSLEWAFMSNGLQTGDLGHIRIASKLLMSEQSFNNEYPNEEELSQ